MLLQWKMGVYTSTADAIDIDETFHERSILINGYIQRLKGIRPAFDGLLGIPCHCNHGAHRKSRCDFRRFEHPKKFQGLEMLFGMLDLLAESGVDRIDSIASCPFFMALKEGEGCSIN